jgi:hypothetical protein
LILVGLLLARYGQPLAFFITGMFCSTTRESSTLQERGDNLFKFWPAPVILQVAYCIWP